MSEEEIWRPIPGMGLRFEVSSLARIRSKARVENHPRGPRRLQERIMRQHVMSAGYLCFGGRADDGALQTTMLIHRAVALAFIPNPDCKREVNHKDGIRIHNLPTNLEWSTSLENVRHSFEVLKSHPKRFGEECVMSVLTEKQVEMILSLSKRFYPADIAHALGVSGPTVRCIVSGKTWNAVRERMGIAARPDDGSVRMAKRGAAAIAAARNELGLLVAQFSTARYTQATQMTLLDV